MELEEFLLKTQKEIHDEMIERESQLGEDMPFKEHIFTEIVTNHMSSIGMTFEEPQVCDYLAKIGNANVQISGYALSENCEQLDLFITLYKDFHEIFSIPDSETAKAAEYCSRFLIACVEGKLSTKMDTSSDAYPLVLNIEQTYSQLDQIRIYILTDGKVKTRQFKSRFIQGKTIILEVMDIVRLYNHLQEGKPRDELIVNFNEVSGMPLPCIWVSGETEGYDYAMTVVPGEALRFLYDKYGARILEANVRSFLSQTGKINKGISKTLREQPERFMAYNNGIVIIADEARLGRSADGGTGISWLKGMQIVNGGQTTASMFFTKKKFPATDLRRVRVPAKIIILKETDPAQEEALISDISQFANSQNKVSASDLSANKPFHIEMEKRANTTFCPDGYGRWFYERAAGSYKVMLEKEGKTPAGIKRLKEAIPASRKITKTDLAKYLCAWKQRPELVSLGGQKNFIAFMEMMGSSPSEDDYVIDINAYKEMIAQCIVFKEAQKLIRKKFPAFQANITAYTISILSNKFSSKFNFNYVWLHQTISSELSNYILEIATKVDIALLRTAKGKMISEWAKKLDCWREISTLDYDNPLSIIPELTVIDEITSVG